MLGTTVLARPEQQLAALNLHECDAYEYERGDVGPRQAEQLVEQLHPRAHGAVCAGPLGPGIRDGDEAGKLITLVP